MGVGHFNLLWYNLFMSIPEIIRKKTLFWEYDFDAVDVSEHRFLVIGRILEYGDVEEIRWMLGEYDRGDIVETILHKSALGKKSQNFWKHYFDIDETVCMNKPSTQTPSAFSKR